MNMTQNINALICPHTITVTYVAVQRFVLCFELLSLRVASVTNDIYDGALICTLRMKRSEAIARSFVQSPTCALFMAFFKAAESASALKLTAGATVPLQPSLRGRSITS